VEARNQCHRLAEYWELDRALSLPFDDPAAAAKIVRQTNSHNPPAAVLAVDDEGVEAAAMIAAELGLQTNRPSAVAMLRDKYRFRQLQQRANLPCPGVQRLPLSRDTQEVGPTVGFPCVVKPSNLSGSRGVIRANDQLEYANAVERVRSIMRDQSKNKDSALLVEQYLPGSEHALEGLVIDGVLTTLAIFDKPDSMVGPYFEETIYVTPSKMSGSTQSEFVRQVQSVCTQSGLREGPVHAEARVQGEQVTLLEVAPRSIGGLCGRVLRHGLGMTLEEMILRHATGQTTAINSASNQAEASGVLMLPVLTDGVVERIEGVDEALRIPGIVSLEITTSPGQRVKPLPEASMYLGFVFAQGKSTDEVTQALHAAVEILEVKINPMVSRPSMQAF
jgi:biotin carboxylase